MAQLIPLLLLLVVQLPLVLGIKIWVPEGSNVTLRSSQLKKGWEMYDARWYGSCGKQGNSSACYNNIASARGVNTTHPPKDLRKYNVRHANADLTIYNLKPEDSRTYTCMSNGSSQDYSVSYHLKVVNGCKRELLNDISFIGKTIELGKRADNASQCRQHCTKNSKCQYFSFNERDKMCFLKSSITIKYDQGFISGYILRNCAGKVMHSAKKYVHVPLKKNWTDAKAHCENNHTSLAIIHTEADSETIKMLLQADAWIGLRRQNHKTWKWSNEEDYMYINWEEGYDSVQHDCAISVNSHWRPLQCTDVKPFVCQNVTHRGGTTEKKYTLIKDPKTIEKAEQYCNEQELKIASITTLHEQQAFNEVTEKISWIGLRRAEQSWNWTSGEPAPKNKDWLNPDSDEDCIKMTDGGWEGDSCSSKNEFLCSTDDDLNTPDSHGLRFIQEAKSWIDALEHCLSQKSNLVHITNQNMRDVDQLLRDKDFSGVWIGLKRAIFGCNVPWVWNEGPPVTMNQWHSSFPVDMFNHQCGKIISSSDSSTELKWLDAGCHEKLPFICQRPNA